MIWGVPLFRKHPYGCIFFFAGVLSSQHFRIWIFLESKKCLLAGCPSLTRWDFKICPPETQGPLCWWVLQETTIYSRCWEPPKRKGHPEIRHKNCQHIAYFQNKFGTTREKTGAFSAFCHGFLRSEGFGCL